MSSKTRPSWDEYFSLIAHVVSTRSNCVRRNVGAVIVDQQRNIISTGYNSPSRGMKHCDEGGCPRASLDIKSGELLEMCTAVHAEINAIIQAATQGRSTLGSTLYCTNRPCSQCTKTIINAGIGRVVYASEYSDALLESGLMDTEDVVFERSPVRPVVSVEWEDT